MSDGPQRKDELNILDLNLPCDQISWDPFQLFADPFLDAMFLNFPVVNEPDVRLATRMPRKQQSVNLVWTSTPSTRSRSTGGCFDLLAVSVGTNAIEEFSR